MPISRPIGDDARFGLGVPSEVARVRSLGGAQGDSGTIGA